MLSSDELATIFEFLWPQEMLVCGWVCKDWYRAVQLESTWYLKFHNIIKQEVFSSMEDLELPTEINYREAVLSKWFALTMSDTRVSGACLPTQFVQRMQHQISQGITIQMWFKAEAGGVLFGVQNMEFPSGTAFVPMIYVSTSSTVFAGFWDSQQGGSLFYESEPINFNWHHVALVGNSQGFEVYLDGDCKVKQPATIDQTKLFYGQIGSGLCDGWRDTNMNYGVNSYTFSGLISDVQIWGRALNEREIHQSMVSPKSVPHYENSLWANWLFRKHPVNLHSSSPQTQISYRNCSSTTILS